MEGVPGVRHGLGRLVGRRLITACGGTSYIPGGVLTEEHHYDIDRLLLSHMVELASAVRHLGADATSMEEAALEVVGFLREAFTLANGDSQLPLVRLYQTQSFGDLPDELKTYAQKLLQPGDHAFPKMPCLTLLATCGDEEAWNSPRLSRSHRCIPLASVEVVDRSPMISQLIAQFGIGLGTILDPSPELILDLDQNSFNVFHVADAIGSEYIPDQDFVRDSNIRSVLGFGGMFPSGDLFAVVMFSRVPIPHQTAEMFKTVALSVKVALLAHLPKKTFAPAGEIDECSA